MHQHVTQIFNSASINIWSRIRFSEGCNNTGVYKLRK